MDAKRRKMIDELSRMYAFSLEFYGVDISGKLETAAQISYALEQAYMRGFSNGLDYARKK